MVFTLYGWWHWWRGVREEGEVRVELLTLRAMLVALAAGVLGSFVLGMLAERIHAALPHLDATLMSYCLVASWWGARKHIANWWLWIAVDVIYVGEYIYKGLWPTALLYAGLWALRSWSARLAARRRRSNGGLNYVVQRLAVHVAAQFGRRHAQRTQAQIADSKRPRAA